uniref:Acetylglutamate kinase n=1 Tax=Vertebrata lanosa TaxID=1261582 RepID=A0A0B5VUM6_9FLOR|nr:acetylglutamate kinase [Vertebrata lanosa]AJH65893.1 acetylglutamate kinase [Vertebrata lanosa]
MSNSIMTHRFYFSSETISLIRKHAGATFVIKYGGSVMKNEVVQCNVIEDIALLYSLGIKIILVHGGGYAIDAWLKRLNLHPEFENGVRITDAPTVEVVEMVLSGQVNKKLVSLFNNVNIPAVGLSGKDANLVVAFPISKKSGNFTGRVSRVNAGVLHTLTSNGFLPVVSSVASNSSGVTYNINADTVASSIAAAMQADKFILLTDTPGILVDVNKPETLMKDLNVEKIKKLKSDGIVKDGMIPKVDSCLHALGNDVKAAHIIDGRLRYSLLHELFTCNRSGSMIVL